MGKFQKKNPPMGKGIAVLVCSALVLGVIMAVALSLPRPEPVPETQPAQPAAPTLAANPYGPGDFFYLGSYLSCFQTHTVPGVDVSSHQKDIRWEEVRQGGIQFAMVRLGYRGYTEGTLQEDEYQARYLQGAKAAGLEVGAYFFSQAISVEEAVEEAKFALSLLQGQQLDLPLVFDWEYIDAQARTGQATKELVTACALAFCREVEAAGYRAMVYFNPHSAENYLDLTQLTPYGFWLAHYSDQMSFPWAVDVWQYTDGGTVPGIDTPVDVNLAFGSFFG